MISLSLFVSCTAHDVSIDENTIPPSQEESVPGHESPQNTAEQPQDSNEDGHAEDDNDSVFPYTGYDFNTPFPSGFFDIDEDFDYKNNNNYLEGLSFFLDEADFSQIHHDEISFLEFLPTDEHETGSCRISLLVEPIEALYYFAHDKNEELLEIETLNGAVRFFIQLNGLELFTYFAEFVHDKYVPGALFTGEYGTGFVFYTTDSENVYSIVFFSYDSEYAQKHTEIITMLLSSLYYLPTD